MNDNKNKNFNTKLDKLKNNILNQPDRIGNKRKISNEFRKIQFSIDDSD